MGRSPIERTTTPEVAVIGGGVIGLAIAWRISSAGARVAVVDESPGRGASWAAAGMLAPVTEVHYGEEALLRLNLDSARRYPQFIAELEDFTDTDAGYRACGIVVAARDADENAALEDLYNFQQKLGLSVERLSGRECRKLEPALAPTVRGGILCTDDHQVDNRALVASLLEACRRAGVSFVRAQAADVRANGRVDSVRLEGGDEIVCGTVVLAAGCWSSSIVEGLPADAIPPVRPVKGQLLQLRGPAEPELIGRSVRGTDVYIVPRRDGRVVVGATVEEMGWDTTVTAGAVYGLLRDAYELLPGISELQLTETVAGLRPGTPDNAPLLGPSSIEGLIVATGHYRNGILLAPLTADAIAEVITTGKTPELIAPFSPQRFNRGERITG